MWCKLVLVAVVSAAAAAVVVSAAPPQLSSYPQRHNNDATAAAAERFLATLEVLLGFGQREFDADAQPQCKTAQDKWACCIEVQSQTVCAALIFVPQEKNMQVGIYVDGQLVLTGSFPAAQPPPQMCKSEDDGSLCLLFTKMAYQSTVYSGCVVMKIVYQGQVMVDEDLGCFKMPLGVEERSPGAIPLIFAEKAVESSPMRLLFSNNNKHSEKKPDQW